MQKLNYLFFTILLLSITLNINAQFTEQEIKSYSTLEWALKTTPIDIDGDGDLDLLTVFFNNKSITGDHIDLLTWYENVDGEGTYERRNDIEYGDVDNSNYNYSFIVEDMDGDNDIDFVMSRESGLGGGINFFENDGAGTFTKHNLFPYTSQIKPADFDNDGDIDIIVNQNVQMFWIENQGGGNFDIKSNFIDLDGKKNLNGGVGSILDFDIADTDNDGDLDIIAATKWLYVQDGEITLFTNDGSGAFTQNMVNELYHIISIKSKDIDNDGDIDIVAGGELDKIVWYDNDGSGNFSSEHLIDNAPAETYEFCDVDGNGSQDLIVGHYTRLLLYRFIGGEYQTAETVYSSAINIKDIAVAYINSDTSIDIISTSNRDSKIAWLSGDGSGNFGSANIINSFYFMSDLISHDIDNDGDLDFIACSQQRSNILLFENTDGNGNFTESLITDQTILPGFISIGDINGDATEDLIVYNYGDSTISWYNGIYGTKQIAVETSLWLYENIFLEDIDMDGDLDILVSSRSYDNSKLVWYENTNGLGDFSSGNVIINEGFVRSSYPADIDNDGDIDIVLSYIDDTSSYYKIYLNDGNENFTLNQEIYIGNSDYQFDPSLYVTDIDNDGDLDFIGTVKHYISSDIFYNYLYWYENDGGTFGTQHSYLVGNVRSMKIEDIDNDNDIDVILLEHDDIVYYENTDGLGNFEIGANKISNKDARCAFTLGDFNNDNKKDIISSSLSYNEELLLHINNMTISINDINPINFIVYPVPSSGIINIDTKGAIVNEVEIVDIKGKKQKLLIKSDIINISNFKSGIYFLNIKIDNKVFTKKIIKK